MTTPNVGEAALGQLVRTREFVAACYNVLAIPRRAVAQAETEKERV
jgi:hypothetical protein